MSLRALQAGIVFLVGIQTVLGQSANSTTGAPAQHLAAAQAARPDLMDVKIQEALRERDAIIRNLLQRVQDLETRLNESSLATAATAALKAPAPASTASSKVVAVVTNSTYDEEERRASESLDQALLVRGGLLLPNGTIEVDNTASYFSASSDHLVVNGFALLPVLVVGDITSQRLRRDILIHSVTTRLGLPRKFQLDFTVPYGYVLNRTVDANNRETTASQFGLGDIQAGLSRQLALEHGRVPDLLANFRYKSVTGTNSYDLQSAETSLGTGFHALQANLTAAKSSDPVVFFGNLSYTKSLPAHHTIPVTDPTNPSVTSTIGYLRPGDTFGFQLGSILALNTETSVTLGWDQRFTRETKLNGSPLASSYLVEGSLRVGTSYMYAPGRTLDLSFGVGLTPDTPNLQFSVGFPFRKMLWKPM
ncbi:MAG: hypothetical protein NVSMB62_18880 [Acidobacteriaceae bacterium]